MADINSPKKAVNLAGEIAKLTKQIQRYNNPWHRFSLGLVAGVGTALGATVIATLILLLLGPILRSAGLDINRLNQAETSSIL